MKITLFLAMSANGIIARENSGEDFLSDENWKMFCKLVEETGCLITSRKAYGTVKQWKDFNFDKINAKKIIVSRNKSLKLKDNYYLASSPKDSIKKVQELKFDKAILSSGSELNRSFMDTGLINNIILNIEPAILGRGIKLFSNKNFYTKLKLLSLTKRKGIVQLRYKVIK